MSVFWCIRRTGQKPAGPACCHKMGSGPQAFDPGVYGVLVQYQMCFLIIDLSFSIGNLLIGRLNPNDVCNFSLLSF